MNCRNYIFFVLIVFSLLGLSCSESDKSGSPRKQYNLSSENNQNIQTEIPDNSFSASSELQINTNLKPQTKSALQADKLFEFLPKSIPGMVKQAPSKGVQNWKGTDIIVVSNLYQYKGGGTLIYITDYANKDNIPSYELEEFERLTTKKIDGISIVEVPDGKAYINFTEPNKSGVLNVLLAERFVIKIDATNLPQNAPALIGIYKLIRTDKLLQLAEKLKI